MENLAGYDSDEGTGENDKSEGKDENGASLNDENGASLNDEWAAFEKLISSDAKPPTGIPAPQPQMIQYPSATMYATQFKKIESPDANSSKQASDSDDSKSSGPGDSRLSRKRSSSDEDEDTEKKVMKSSQHSSDDSDASSDAEDKEEQVDDKSDETDSGSDDEEMTHKTADESDKHSRSGKSASPGPQLPAKTSRERSPVAKSRNRSERSRRDGRDHRKRHHSPHRRRRSREHRRRRSRSRDHHRHRRHHRHRSGSPRNKRRRSRSGDRHRSYGRKRGRGNYPKGKGRNKRHSSSSSRSPSRKQDQKQDKPLNFKEKLKQQLMDVQNNVSSPNVDSDKLREILAKAGSSSGVEKPSQLSLGSNNPLLTMALNSEGKVTPQQAVLAQMAAMHQKAQELTGVAVPKYYNPAAVNPLKYAEQIQKRKLLWAKTKEPKEEVPVEDNFNKKLWQSTSFGGGKTDEKFRKLMGIKGEEGSPDNSELTQEQIRKQQELFENLDKEYAFARLTTHTHRGMGLGIVSTSYLPPTAATLAAASADNEVAGSSGQKNN